MLLQSKVILSTSKSKPQSYACYVVNFQPLRLTKLWMHKVAQVNTEVQSLSSQNRLGYNNNCTNDATLWKIIWPLKMTWAFVL